MIHVAIVGGGDKKFDTQLSPKEEEKFKDWKSKYAPKDSGIDYDLRGAFKAGIKPDPETGHWPDTYRKPNHPTFSDQSIYAPYAPEKAGHWDGDTYISPQQLKDPFEGTRGLLSAQPIEVRPYQHGTARNVYDPQELSSLVQALRRIGIFDLAEPPEKMRAPINNALPQPSSLYGTENISF